MNDLKSLTDNTRKYLMNVYDKMLKLISEIENNDYIRLTDTHKLRLDITDRYLTTGNFKSAIISYCNTKGIMSGNFINYKSDPEIIVMLNLQNYKPKKLNVVRLDSVIKKMIIPKAILLAEVQTI